jgi:hypothetical protein
VRAGPGRIALSLEPGERRILGRLVAELRTRLDDPAALAPDGALARLVPPAFPGDPDAEASYVALVRDDLLDGRRRRLALVEATIDRTELDDDEALAWMAVLNDLRLALGTVLGVTEDDEPTGPSPDDAQAFPRAVFAWLGWLVGSWVEVLEDTLPDATDDDP